MPNIALDTEEDTLYCAVCHQKVAPEEPKTVIGVMTDWGTVLVTAHPKCSDWISIDTTCGD